MNKDIAALTKCFFCGKDDRILLASKFDREGEPIQDMKQFHGKAVDHEPCEECAKHMKQGIILIGIKEGDPNYRTGEFFVIKEEAVKRWATLAESHGDTKSFEMFLNAVRVRCLMIEQPALKAMGFPVKEDK